jgi:hypothetical protein
LQLLPAALAVPAAKTGGAAVPLGSSPAAGLMALDGDYVYFLLGAAGGPQALARIPKAGGNDAAGRVARLPPTGGTPVVIAQGGICPMGVIVDATQAYFADRGTAAADQLTNTGTISIANKCGCP